MTLTSDVADRTGGNRSAAGELTPVELGAWRGFLRVHTALVRELDAELLAAHDLPLSSYDVLIYLQSAPGKRLSDELEESEAMRVVDDIVGCGVPYVMLCGGEPLVVPHFLRVN